jgi:hypothetical protein
LPARLDVAEIIAFAPRRPGRLYFPAFHNPIWDMPARAREVMMRLWLRFKSVCGPAVLAMAAGAALLVAASYARAADPVFPPASRIGLAPPPGFVVSSNFLGFQHSDKQATILMAELPNYAFETIEKEVAAELKKDQTPATRTDVTFKEGRGFVLFAKPSSPQGPVLKWTMVANVGSATAIVTVLIPEAVQDVASDQAVRDSLASLAVRTVPIDEQLSALPFALNQLAGFRLVRVQPGNAAMLTDGPKDGVEATEQPLLLISLVHAPNHPQPAERDGFARRLLGDVPGLKDVRVTRSEPLRVAGQQGYEILVEAKDAKTDQEINAVQWLRFGSGTLMRVVGIARKDVWADTFRRFREVRDGLGPK